MSVTEKIGLAVLKRMDPERAHNLALWALRKGMSGDQDPITSSRLETKLASLTLPNPLGLAAGFDKNADALPALLRSGLGFIEVGATTPLAQPGNPKPRLFRLPKNQAVINRFGFNNNGAMAMAERLATKRPKGIVGLNLGANKDSKDRIADYGSVMVTCGAHIDFATVNVSSPNTEALRDLQGKEALWALLSEVVEARAQLPDHHRPPVFLKIAPDIHPDSLADIAEIAMKSSLNGIIATNTTVKRPMLDSPHAGEMGGLSGAPLFNRSTAVLARMHELTEGKVPLIGVGGIGSAEDAFTKVLAGATALQMYSALAYHGLTLAHAILKGLDKRAKQLGLKNLSEARGQEAKMWSDRLA
ncbi:MAG: quinone-dependent dihydroorotate dehydrogenase [Pseudomonadota bacterium]